MYKKSSIQKDARENKKEIVLERGFKTFSKAGKSIEPKDWNELIKNPEVTIIDTVIKEEIDIGSFPNALNPRTDCFREFPSFVDELNEIDKKKPVAMFCTHEFVGKRQSYMLEMSWDVINLMEEFKLSRKY